MSVEDRLYILAEEYRALHGLSALADPARGVANLSAAAPDLRVEILALAAAIDGGAATRIATAPDPASETIAVVSEIAKRDKLSGASVTSAVAVAYRLNTTPMAQPAPRIHDWAHDSVIAGSGPAAPYEPSVATPPMASRLEPACPEPTGPETADETGRGWLGTTKGSTMAWLALVAMVLIGLAWLLLISPYFGNLPA